jgi:multimeric flavodoxin WrbA
MTAKNILALISSPRKNGNSTILCEKIIEGARESGAKVTTINLNKTKIKACTACDKCHISDSSFCVLKDDMSKIYPKIIAADTIIYASPIYWFTISAQLKIFMDRCYALGGPSGYALKGKKMAIALTYGDDDPFRSGAVNALRTLQDSFAFVGAELIGSVYATGLKPGDVLKNKIVLKEAFTLGKALSE